MTPLSSRQLVSHLVSQITKSDMIYLPVRWKATQKRGIDVLRSISPNEAELQKLLGPHYARVVGVVREGQRQVMSMQASTSTPSVNAATTAPQASRSTAPSLLPTLSTTATHRTTAAVAGLSRSGPAPTASTSTLNPTPTPIAPPQASSSIPTVPATRPAPPNTSTRVPPTKRRKLAVLPDPNDIIDLTDD